MGHSDGVQPYDGAEMILMDIRDELRSLCALLRGGAGAKPAVKAVEEPVNLVETTTDPPKSTPKKAAPKSKPRVKKRRPTTKKKPSA